MRTLTLEDLRALITHESMPCVSMYMPTRRGGSAEDKTRYNSLLNRARDLVRPTCKPQQLEHLMAPLEELSQDEIWSNALDGMAIFRAEGFVAVYPVPLAVEELCLVANSFHIRPLLRYLQSNEPYFLLNLSQNRVSLFKGSAYGLGPVELPTLPRSMSDALGAAQRDNPPSLHPGKQTPSPAPVAHGNGKDDSVRDEDLHHFLRQVDKALYEFLRDETAPLVVAATERIAAAFERVSRYPHLLHEHVGGSFANARIEDLQARAWPLVQKFAEARLTEAKGRYGDLISRKRAVDELSAIASFAVQGRVRDLLVDRDAHLWGRMDRATGMVEIHPGKPGPLDDDVLDDIAEAVLLRGGQVLTLAKDQMPTRSPVAACLRW